MFIFTRKIIQTNKTSLIQAPVRNGVRHEEGRRRFRRLGVRAWRWYPAIAFWRHTVPHGQIVGGRCVISVVMCRYSLNSLLFSTCRLCRQHTKTHFHTSLRFCHTDFYFARLLALICLFWCELSVVAARTLKQRRGICWPTIRLVKTYCLSLRFDRLFSSSFLSALAPFLSLCSFL